MSTDPSLTNFNGKARLFPLPNLVVYPHIVQPLHIFEPRYRQMTADALEGDRLIAMCLLQQGWEEEYEGRPALHPIACLGKIVADQQLPDGRYNILLRGVGRVRIEHEFPHSQLYRLAKVELLSDIDPEPQEEDEIRQRLLAAVPGWFPDQEAVVEKIQSVLGKELPLGALCDVISFALSVDIEAKQALLAETNVARRVQRLFECMAPKPVSVEKPPRKFPPQFSEN